ncbi:hypothetical protein STCU_11567 [Strigomonas culicis]|uniref:C2 domain-containing protein n=1 Tax=Strigomonas culicis TaxID=28005 RepID=S9TDJ1_9TRYP|nr:hypothetical protein STCU_11567 [Strigomonas culicis]|eukprot:EPY16072.1 hypothetical protein STCU_11567 [Strigomonas culicis]
MSAALATNQSTATPPTTTGHSNNASTGRRRISSPMLLPGQPDSPTLVLPVFVTEEDVRREEAKLRARRRAQQPASHSPNPRAVALTQQRRKKKTVGDTAVVAATSPTVSISATAPPPLPPTADAAAAAAPAAEEGLQLVGWVHCELTCVFFPPAAAAALTRQDSAPAGRPSLGALARSRFAAMAAEGLMDICVVSAAGLRCWPCAYDAAVPGAISTNNTGASGGGGSRGALLQSIVVNKASPRLPRAAEAKAARADGGLCATYCEVEALLARDDRVADPPAASPLDGNDALSVVSNATATTAAAAASYSQQRQVEERHRAEDGGQSENTAHTTTMSTKTVVGTNYPVWHHTFRVHLGRISTLLIRLFDRAVMANAAASTAARGQPPPPRASIVEAVAASATEQLLGTVALSTVTLAAMWDRLASASEVVVWFPLSYSSGGSRGDRYQRRRVSGAVCLLFRRAVPLLPRLAAALQPQLQQGPPCLTVPRPPKQLADDPAATAAVDTASFYYRAPFDRAGGCGYARPHTTLQLDHVELLWPWAASYCLERGRRGAPTGLVLTATTEDGFYGSYPLAFAAPERAAEGRRPASAFQWAPSSGGSSLGTSLAHLAASTAGTSVVFNTSATGSAGAGARRSRRALAARHNGLTLYAQGGMSIPLAAQVDWEVSFLAEAPAGEAGAPTRVVLGGGRWRMDTDTFDHLTNRHHGQGPAAAFFPFVKAEAVVVLQPLHSTWQPSVYRAARATAGVADGGLTVAGADVWRLPQTIAAGALSMTLRATTVEHVAFTEPPAAPLAPAQVAAAGAVPASGGGEWVWPPVGAAAALTLSCHRWLLADPPGTPCRLARTAAPPPTTVWRWRRANCPAAPATVRRRRRRRSSRRRPRWCGGSCPWRTAMPSAAAATTRTRRPPTATATCCRCSSPHGLPSGVAARRRRSCCASRFRRRCRCRRPRTARWRRGCHPRTPCWDLS